MESIPATPETTTDATPAWKEFQKIILKRAKEADACAEQYKRAKSAKDEKALLEAVRDNIGWCINQKVVDSAFLKEFTPEVLVEVGIFFSGTHEVRGCAAACFENSTVRSYGNSTVRSYGNSTVESFENSTVRSYGNSTVESYGNSTVRSFENSTVRSYGNSTVESFENSTVRSFENSTVESFGNSTAYVYNGKVSNPSERAIIRYQDYYGGPTTKIIVRKSAFEIVEFEEPTTSESK
jgi:hypothetical protein